MHMTTEEKLQHFSEVSMETARAVSYTHLFLNNQFLNRIKIPNSLLELGTMLYFSLPLFFLHNSQTDFDGNQYKNSEENKSGCQ